MPPDLSPEAGNNQPDSPDSLVTVTPEATVTTAPVGVTEPPVVDTPAKEADTVHQVPEAEFKKLKEKAHAKGHKAALATITSQVKDAGFDSLEDALAQIPQLNARLDELLAEPEPQPKGQRPMAQPKKKTTHKKSGQQPRRTNSRSKEARMETQGNKEIARLERERSKARENWRKEEKRRKSAERKLAAKEAEIELRQIAMEQGVKDVDYAIRLMTRELTGKSKEDLASFNEAEFFVGLKSDRPYLFGETTVPATTGTGAGDDDTPPEPKPGEVLTKTAEDTHFDARDATKEDVDKRMRELGLNTSGSVNV